MTRSVVSSGLCVPKRSAYRPAPSSSRDFAACNPPIRRHRPGTADTASEREPVVGVAAAGAGLSGVGGDPALVLCCGWILGCGLSFNRGLGGSAPRVAAVARAVARRAGSSCRTAVRLYVGSTAGRGRSQLRSLLRLLLTGSRSPSGELDLGGIGSRWQWPRSQGMRHGSVVWSGGYLG